MKTHNISIVEEFWDWRQAYNRMLALQSQGLIAILTPFPYGIMGGPAFKWRVTAERIVMREASDGKRVSECC